MIAYFSHEDMKDERAILMKVIKGLSEENTGLKAEIVNLKDKLAGLYDAPEEDDPSKPSPF